MIPKEMALLLKEIYFRYWSNSSAGKSTSCSSGRHEFSSQPSQWPAHNHLYNSMDWHMAQTKVTSEMTEPNL